MVETEGLVSGLDRLVTSFDELINLLFGLAASFGEENFGALDGWSFNFLVTV